MWRKSCSDTRRVTNRLVIGGAISPPGNQLYLTQGFPGGSFDIKAVGTNAAQHLSVAGTDYYTLLFFGNTSGAGSLLTTSCHNLVCLHRLTPVSAGNPTAQATANQPNRSGR